MNCVCQIDSWPDFVRMLLCVATRHLSDHIMLLTFNISFCIRQSEWYVSSHLASFISLFKYCSCSFYIMNHSKTTALIYTSDVTRAVFLNIPHELNVMGNIRMLLLISPSKNINEESKMQQSKGRFLALILHHK